VSINTEDGIDVFLNSLNIINEMHTCKTNDHFCEKNPCKTPLFQE